MADDAGSVASINGPSLHIDLGHVRMTEEMEVYMTPQMKHRVYVTTAGPAVPGSAGRTSFGAGADATRRASSVNDDGMRSVFSAGGGGGHIEVPPLSRMSAACYSVGHFMNDATASCWFSYLLLYLQDAQGLSASESGIVLFSGQIADALATPIVGFLSDRSGGIPCLGFGRRKAWNFMGCVIVVICFFFVFGFCIPCAVHTDGSSSSTEKAAVFALFASLFNVGWAAVQVSHMCMVPELTHDEGQRVVLNSARYAFTVLANVFVFCVMWVILHFYRGGDEKNKYDPMVYSYLTYAVIAFGSLLSLVFLAGTTELHYFMGGGGSTDGKGKYASLPTHHETDETSAALEDALDGHRAPAPTNVKAATSGRTTAVGRRRRNSASDASAGGVTASAGNASKRALKAATTSSAELHEPAHLTSPLLDNECDKRSNGARADAVVAEGGRPKHMTWRDWLKLLDFYKVASVYMFVRLAVNVSQVYLTFFVTETLQMDQTAIAVVPLLVYLSSLLATFVTKRIDTRFGRRKTMTLGALLFAGACVTMVFLQHSSSSIMYAASVLLGCGSAVTTVISVSLEADLVGKNVESAAFLYGAISLTDKLSNGVAVLAIQYIRDTITSTPERETFIRYVNAVVPAIAIALAAIIAWTITFSKVRFTPKPAPATVSSGSSLVAIDAAHASAGSEGASSTADRLLTEPLPQPAGGRRSSRTDSAPGLGQVKRRGGVPSATTSRAEVDLLTRSDDLVPISVEFTSPAFARAAEDEQSADDTALLSAQR